LYTAKLEGEENPPKSTYALARFYAAMELEVVKFKVWVGSVSASYFHSAQLIWASLALIVVAFVVFLSRKVAKECCISKLEMLYKELVLM
jgi:hypothetical protein